MSTDKSPSEEAAELRDKLDGLRASDPAPQVAAAKQQVSDTAANVSDTVNQTASSMKETAANVRDAVMPPLRQGADAVRGAVATARDKVQQANDGADALSDRIRDQPFLALGVAVLTGYVLGRAYR